MNSLIHSMPPVCTYTMILVTLIVTQYLTTSTITYDEDHCVVEQAHSEICDYSTHNLTFESYQIDQEHSLFPRIQGELAVFNSNLYTYEIGSIYNPEHTYEWFVIGPAEIISSHDTEKVQVRYHMSGTDYVILKLVEKSKLSGKEAIAVSIVYLRTINA